MKKITLLFFFLSLNIVSQESKLKRVDKIVKSYRDFNTIEALAKQIDNDYSTAIEKARAAYSWISMNLTYNNKNPFEISNTTIYVVSDQNDYIRRVQKNDEKIMMKAFKTKSAVCKGYALLFKRICDLLKIENQLVLGYIKNSSYQIGYMPSQKNHAWNVIKIDGKWIFIDPTQGSGYSIKNVWQPKFNPDFFNIKKDILKNTHFAEKTYWRNYVNQMPLKEFSRLPVFSKAYFNSSFDIVSPSNGLIEAKKKRPIQLRFKDIDFDTKIHYKFGEYSKLKKANVTYSNSIFWIQIQSPREDSTLKIYVDGEEALSYLVYVK
ncbi:transglutaminase domain-containing protein [Pseudotenacibaculum sp. MALMAid0570]|uniref:transglutaminase domain-containing protein n=1 Tax=Pseudotenacibaculum sp. MALMAid0570 TaxID=3143938 RepID=UPI0032E01A63